MYNYHAPGFGAFQKAIPSPEPRGLSPGAWSRGMASGYTLPEPRLGNFRPDLAGRKRNLGSSRPATRPAVNRPSPRGRLETQGYSGFGRDPLFTFPRFFHHNTRPYTHYTTLAGQQLQPLQPPTTLVAIPTLALYMPGHPPPAIARLLWD
ncbi:hypothetical protein PGT21_032319 [Puccinia graminis f. sp. tritici]|uniref:Uncharacterized protein n=1 Tax=Puccinia graminis f. sp. tritici TaxID=56615 RepID=A0A5B0PPJ0_PUCGR|nr:hypothetical protein PGT21_032319 [Puccinia graminis f. sp. tritici]